MGGFVEAEHFGDVPLTVVRLDEFHPCEACPKTAGGRANAIASPATTVVCPFGVPVGVSVWTSAELHAFSVLSLYV